MRRYTLRYQASLFSAANALTSSATSLPAGFVAPRGTQAPGLYGSFRKLRVPYFGVLVIRILLFRVLY